MKKYKIILFAIVGALLLHGCYDEKMEWGTPEDHNPIKSSEIPLNLAEKIANYDFIKTYVPAGMIVGIGAGADLYISDPAYKKVVDDNFQMITTGNAMKHSSVVRNNGSLDFTTIDAFMDAIPADMKVLGHTLLWHTQQRQAYLKSL
ncbi:MAG TPA: endo-1,4-beta-xylanase, partial [Proteiniphilum sp.]|nr:endo-1,4-beta-xylanase [Proteiniphilum sp.]